VIEIKHRTTGAVLLVVDAETLRGANLSYAHMMMPSVKRAYALVGRENRD